MSQWYERAALGNFSGGRLAVASGSIEVVVAKPRAMLLLEKTDCTHCARRHGDSLNVLIIALHVVEGAPSVENLARAQG